MDNHENCMHELNHVFPYPYLYLSCLSSKYPGGFNRFYYYENLKDCVNEILHETLFARCEITYWNTYFSDHPLTLIWVGFLGVLFEVCVCVCGGEGGGLKSPQSKTC